MPGRRARCSGVGLWSEKGRAAGIRLGRTAGGLDSGGKGLSIRGAGVEGGSD